MTLMQNIRIVDGKKFMWDGQVYDSKALADETASNYSKDRFEVRVFEETGKYLVYTRRVVSEVVVEEQN